MAKAPQVTIIIKDLLGTEDVHSAERFSERLGEVLLVGSIPIDGVEDKKTWSFITRQGVADLSDDPESFREAQVWPLRSRGRLTKWLNGSVTIGRAESNDVWIDSRNLSKVHARFRMREGRWELADADSKNGTSVNGTPLPPNEFKEIKDGDRIHFAGVPCRIFSAVKLRRILKFMVPDIEDNSLSRPPDTDSTTP